MKLLKLIPAAAIVLTLFTTFEAKADYPSGWTEKNSCTRDSGNRIIYKLQKTDTPASYGTYWYDTNNSSNSSWIIENVSYNCATNWYKSNCFTKKNTPTCNS